MHSSWMEGEVVHFRLTMSIACQPLTFLWTFLTAKLFLDFSISVEATRLRFLSSCDRNEYVVAKETCAMLNGTVFDIKDLFDSRTMDIVNKAIDEHQTIWINQTKQPGKGLTCMVTLRFSNGTNTIEPRDCEDQVHYVCKILSDDGRNISFNESYVPCEEDNRGTSTNSSIIRNAPSLPAVSIFVIGVCTAVPVLLITCILAIYCVTKKNRKPKRYAVRVESAIYHRNNPRPHKGTVDGPDTEDTVDGPDTEDTVDGPDTEDTVDEREVPPANEDKTGFVTGVQLQATVTNGEYDILWKTSGDRLSGERSISTGLYGHLVRNSSKTTSDDGSVYDTTTSPEFDTRTVDNTYARTYLPDQ